LIGERTWVRHNRTDRRPPSQYCDFVGLSTFPSLQEQHEIANFADLETTKIDARELVEQAANNTKAQFAASPTLSKERDHRGLFGQSTMSKQALDSKRARET
jgi:hypothetical protein